MSKPGNLGYDDLDNLIQYLVAFGSALINFVPEIH